MMLSAYSQVELFPKPQEVSPWVLFGAIERLFRKPLTAEMQRKYGTCNSIEDFMDVVCNDHVTQGLLMGDTALGSLCEMYVALRCGLTWQPMDGFDVYGGVLDGLQVAGVRLQVRHSKRFSCHSWKFRTTDNTGERRYDLLVCVGFTNSVAPMGATEFINPCRSQVFVIPVSAIGDTQAIQISRVKYHTQARTKPNVWWEHNIADHRDIENMVTRLAHGKPMRLDPQVGMFDMGDWQD